MRKRDRTNAMNHPIHRSAVAIGVALVLAGCAVGPDYRRPGTTLPADFSAVAPVDRVDPNAAPSAAIAGDWWKVYNDPLLSDLVTASITNNPNIRLAIARVDEAQAALRETNAAFFPEVDYAGNGYRARNGVAGGGQSSVATGQVFYGKIFNAQAGDLVRARPVGQAASRVGIARAHRCSRAPTRAT